MLSPLVLPPNYEKIPTPGSLIENKKNEEEKIKKILKAPVKEKNLTNKPSSIEDAIINNISKWVVLICLLKIILR